MTDRLRKSAGLLLATIRWYFLHTRQEPQDRFARWLFGLSFLAYVLIGQTLNDAGAFQKYNLLFNADCPRIISDISSAHHGAPSLNASAAHPLMLISLTPLGAALTWLFGGSGTLASLVLCHASSALANVIAYALLLRLGVDRSFARFGAILHAVSTTQIVLGSIPETAAPTTLMLTLTLWLAARTPPSASAVLPSLLSFGMNGALLAHALLAPPLLWFARVSTKRWVLLVARFLVLFAALLGFCFLLQREYFPSTTFLNRSGYDAYHGFVQIPASFEAATYRWSRLLPHLLAFSTVAPTPLCTSPPERINTFLWEQKKALATYPPASIPLLVAWFLLLLLALGFQGRALLSRQPLRRNFALLCFGWFFGVFGFFTVFGDDLHLFSFFWQTHLILFVASGLEALKRFRWHGQALLAFLALLALNQLRFLGELLANLRA